MYPPPLTLLRRDGIAQIHASGDRDLRNPPSRTLPMEKPAKGLVAWGEWGSSLVDESGSPPLQRGVVDTKIMNGAIVVGPSVIGSDTTLDEGVYIGPYTSLGNKVTVRRGEIENSILMDGCIIDTEEKIVNSLIGPYSIVTSNSEGRPQGKRLILGERSRVEF